MLETVDAPVPAGSGALAWRPSQNSSTILAQKAGRSSGLRLETRPWSTWTSSSTQVAPALRRSVCSDGHDVSVRPLRTSASTSVHGPWQITPSGFLDADEVAHEGDGVLVGAQEVGIRDAAGQDEPVVVVDVGVGDRLVGGEGLALVEVVEALEVARLEREQLDGGALGLDGLARLGQLDLLDALGGEDRDGLALKFVSHT